MSQEESRLSCVLKAALKRIHQVDGRTQKAKRWEAMPGHKNSLLLCTVSTVSTVSTVLRLSTTCNHGLPLETNKLQNSRDQVCLAHVMFPVACGSCTTNIC